MPVSVTMPALGESVTEGTVTRWLKKEGETVEVDEPLLEVSTDKVDTEIPSPAAGGERPGTRAGTRACPGTGSRAGRPRAGGRSARTGSRTRPGGSGQRHAGRASGAEIGRAHV